jgi:predicted PurR-regulated permease PerM
LGQSPPLAAARSPAEGATAEPARVDDAVARFALIGIFVILLGAALFVAHSVVVPMLSAVVVGCAIGPIVDRTNRLGAPSWVSSIGIVAVFLTVSFLAVTALSTPMSNWLGRAPEFGAVLKQRLEILREPMNALQQINTTINNITGGSNPVVDINQGNMVQTVLLFVTPALSQFVLFFGSLLFFLGGRGRIKGKVALSFEDRENRLAALKIMREIEDSLAAYLITATTINIGLGICTALVLFAIGMPNAIMWGLMAAILNFIPYVGPAIMIGVLFVIGLISFPTFAGALMAPGLFLALATLEGQILTPRIIGHRLTLNPFMIFVGLAFWTWMWGPIGAFLSVPILVIGVVLWQHLVAEDPVRLP